MIKKEKNNKQLLLFKTILILVALLVSFSANYLVSALEWTPPTSGPPEGNVAPPIHQGTTGQVKEGALMVASNSGALGASGIGFIVRYGLVGINMGSGGSPLFDLDVDGDVKANAFFYPSDINLKKEIKPIENALAKIREINGVSFEWKKDEKKSLGVIAQEIERIFPEAVMERGNEKHVDYSILIAPLIEAVKEQQTQIEKLNEEIEKIKREN